MSNFNKSFLLGRIGNIPELKKSANGQPYLVMSVATENFRKGESKTTSWHRVVAFGTLAEVCENYLSKGSTVFVEGSLEVQMYTNADNAKVTRVSVIAYTVQFLDRTHKNWDRLAKNSIELEEPQEMVGEMDSHGGENYSESSVEEEEGFEEDLKQMLN